MIETRRPAGQWSRTRRRQLGYRERCLSFQAHGARLARELYFLPLASCPSTPLILVLPCRSIPHGVCCPPPYATLACSPYGSEQSDSATATSGSCADGSTYNGALGAPALSLQPVTYIELTTSAPSSRKACGSPRSLSFSCVAACCCSLSALTDAVALSRTGHERTRHAAAHRLTALPHASDVRALVRLCPLLWHRRHSQYWCA